MVPQDHMYLSYIPLSDMKGPILDYLVAGPFDVHCNDVHMEPIGSHILIHGMFNGEHKHGCGHDRVQVARCAYCDSQTHQGGPGITLAPAKYTSDAGKQVSFARVSWCVGVVVRGCMVLAFSSTNVKKVLYVCNCEMYTIMLLGQVMCCVFCDSDASHPL